MPRQPRSFRAEAVVLRHSDWGEADRLLTFFTRERGKLRAIAEGDVLELFTIKFVQKELPFVFKKGGTNAIL